MTAFETAVRKVQSETGMDRMQAVNHVRQRNRLRAMPKLRRVPLPVDVLNPVAFPEFAEAIEHARNTVGEGDV